MYKVITLKNNLRIVLEKIDYVNSVSIGLWINNGSRDESEDNNGISHFIEHMLFKGTKKRSAKQLAESIEEVGGQLNAFTGKEATCFYIKVLNSHFELALDVLSDMLFNSNFDTDDIEKEKGVVYEEINMSEDSPEDVLSDIHSKAIWGNDSLSLPILGTQETLKTFTRNQLLGYIKEHYTPENTVISIAGNFPIENIDSLLEEYFGDWESSNKKNIEYSSPIMLNNHIYKLKSIEQIHLSLGLNGVPIGSKDIYTLLILNNIFGGGASSILFQKIREELGLCYNTYSYVTALKNTGALIIYAGMSPEYVYDALYVIKEELKNFNINSISDEKLRKSKEQLKGNYMLGLESTSSRMFSNGKSVLLENKINTPEDILNNIEAINKADVDRVLKQVFLKGIQNSAFVGENIDIKKFQDIIKEDSVAYKNTKSTFV